MNPMLRLLVVNALVSVCAANAQITVQDVFGRTLNQRGITLVDWDGYMANPLQATARLRLSAMSNALGAPCLSWIVLRAHIARQ
jgi:hypothetical protein